MFELRQGLVDTTIASSAERESQMESGAAAAELRYVYDGKLLDPESRSTYLMHGITYLYVRTFLKCGTFTVEQRTFSPGRFADFHHSSIPSTIGVTSSEEPHSEW